MPHDTPNPSRLVKFITLLAETNGQHSPPGYILEHGREFQSEELTDLEIGFTDRIQWDRRAEEQCYHNCQTEAIILPPMIGITLRYAEGYVDHGIGIAVEHAWLSVNGKVVDPTIRTDDPQQRILGVIPDQWSYYGVELEPDACLHALAHEAAIPLIDDPECGFPHIGRGEDTAAIPPTPAHEEQPVSATRQIQRTRSQ